MVAPSIGSIISASSGFCVRTRSISRRGSASSAPIERRNVCSSGRSCVGRAMRSMRSSTGISFRSALSDAPGTEAWPLLPRVVTAKAEHCFSPTPTV